MPVDVMKILQENKDKNFVQRLLYPDMHPKMNRPDLGLGSYSTHLMSYATTDNGAVVYPEIIQQEDQSLKRLDRQEAYNHAMRTGEHIKFDNPEDASWFTENYKSIWNKPKVATPQEY